MHPFEKAGLGKAPFRCVAVTQNWYSAAPGHLQPGGSCDYCGTGIAYEYHIESAAPGRFKVGCDCVWKTYGGDKKAADVEVEGFKEQRRELARVRREAGRAERKASREALWAAERAERLVEFSKAEPEVCSFLDKLLADADPEHPGDFMVQMAKAIRTFGSLTAGQLAAVKSSLARTAQRETDAANSKHVGTVGERITGEFEIIATSCRESSYGWPRKLVYWSLMRYNGRDLVTYSGNYLGNRGDKFRAKFSVKAHDEYKNTLQTKLARPKVEESATV